MRDASKAAGILFLKHVDVAFAAADVDPLAGGVVEQIVRFADDVERNGCLSRRRVVHQDLGGAPTSDKQSMVRLVERHRKIRFRADGRPRRNDFHRGSIDYGNLIRSGHVDESARAGAFELKRLGMTLKLRLADHLAVRGIDGRQRARAVSYEETLRSRIVPDIIRIISKPDR